MKHMLTLSLAAVVLATGSGCSLIDRLFLLNADGPYASQPGGPHAVMAEAESGDTGVQQVGYLQSCTDDCADGGCRDGACRNNGGGIAGYFGDGGMACRDGACGNMGCRNGICVHGGCYGRACHDGSCQACRQHCGRYGGLARHRLTPGERCAHGGCQQMGPAGPPTGAVAYPYYTTRGPRDFLAKCPPSIGP
ncbi:MAG: hypothetical protein ISQ07_06680 [Pirellulales bacterium]|jgi:hypothetical protein|nr:hypothetical protein [Pirellulales bacterium]